MAKVSASNLAERAPVSGTASADVRGANGAAFGSHLISFLKEKSEKVAGINISLKEKLTKFFDFNDDDFTAYFATTKHWREEIAKEAEKMGLNVTKYRASAEGMDYVYVSLSEFDRLARAVQTGWRPEVDRLTWAAIKQAATERMDSEGKAKKIAEVRAELAKVITDPIMSPKAKEANKVLLEEKLVELATVSKPRSAAASTAPKQTNFQIACELLETFEIADMELVRDWLVTRIKAKHAAPTEQGTPTPKNMSAAQAVEALSNQHGKKSANDNQERAVASKGTPTPKGKRGRK